MYQSNRNVALLINDLVWLRYILVDDYLYKCKNINDLTRDSIIVIKARFLERTIPFQNQGI